MKAERRVKMPRVVKLIKIKDIEPASKATRLVSAKNRNFLMKQKTSEIDFDSLAKTNLNIDLESLSIGRNGSFYESHRRANEPQMPGPYG